MSFLPPTFLRVTWPFFRISIWLLYYFEHFFNSCSGYYVPVLVAQSCPTLCNAWTVARQPPLSMGSSRQELWSGLPFPSPGNLPNPGIEPWSPALEADSFLSEPLRLLLLSRFSRVWLCATPETAAHQAPPSLGFSRQEHWRGLPFPSPMQESEKWKWSCSVVSDSVRPVDGSPPGSPVPGILQARTLEGIAISFSSLSH